MAHFPSVYRSPALDAVNYALFVDRRMATGYGGFVAINTETDSRINSNPECIRVPMISTNPGIIRRVEDSILAPCCFVDLLDSLADGPSGHTTALRNPVAGGYLDLTYHQLRDCVDKISGRLRVRLGQTNGDTMTVGYVSLSHFDYVLNLLALLRLGVVPLLLSPRNAIEAQAHLLQSSDCCAILFDASHSTVAKEYQDMVPGLRLIELVGIDDIKDESPGFVAPLCKIIPDEGLLLIMHSSGTTGSPKLIRMSNRYFVAMARRICMIQEHYGFSRSFLAASPLFHLFGLANFLGVFSAGGTTVFPSGTSPAALLRDVEMSRVSFACLLPYQIKQLAEWCSAEPKGWDTLASLDGIHFGGAPLSQELCRLLLQKRVTLFNSYGTTETGFLAGGLASHENITCRRLMLARGLNYSIVNQEGETAQLMIHADEACLASGLCPSGQGYVLGDRIRILSHKEPLEFEVLGRVDDTLVHPSGEKTYPVPMENTLLMSPLIHRCVILNQDNIQNCLLVQLNVQGFSRRPPRDAIHDILTLVEEVNAAAPVYSRIDTAHIYLLPLVTDKELPVTVKGNVARNRAALIFQKEIKRLYGNCPLRDSLFKGKA